MNIFGNMILFMSLKILFMSFMSLKKHLLLLTALYRNFYAKYNNNENIHKEAPNKERTHLNDKD